MSGLTAAEEDICGTRVLREVPMSNAEPANPAPRKRGASALAAAVAALRRLLGALPGRSYADRQARMWQPANDAALPTQARGAAERRAPPLAPRAALPEHPSRHPLQNAP